MIEEIVSLQMPVEERLVVKKNRLEPANVDKFTKRISIVTGTHGDELNGQYVCYKLIERIKAEPDKLKGIVDVYPSINPLGVDTGSRGIPMNDLDMNRVFPGTDSGAMAEYVAYKITQDIIGSDMCIDVHSSNIFIEEVPQVRLSPENFDKLLPYAKLMNANIIWALSSSVYLEASLANCLNMFGVPSLVVEMGVGMRITRAYGEQLLSSLSCRRLVTFHDGFAYFAQAFGLEIAASMEIEAGSEPSARELEEIISLLQDQNIPAVFTEINGTADAAELVSRETGCAVFSLDTAISSVNYLSAMTQNIDTIKEALG